MKVLTLQEGSCAKPWRERKRLNHGPNAKSFPAVAKELLVPPEASLYDTHEWRKAIGVHMWTSR